MSPRPDVSQKRKSQILDAAEVVFKSRGIDQARMDDIVAETGLSKGTLYWYFKSKNEIVIAILDRVFKREFQKLDTLNLSNDNATDNIHRFIDESIKDLAFFLRIMPVAYEFLALAFRNPTVQNAIKLYFNRYLDILEPIIQKGIESGEFRMVDAHEVGLAVTAIFEGTLLLWVYDRSIVNPEKHIRSGIDLLLNGVVRCEE